MDEPTRAGGWRPVEATPDLRLPPPAPHLGPSLLASRAAGPAEPPTPLLPFGPAPGEVAETRQEAPLALLKGLAEAPPRLITRRGMVGLVTVGGLLAGCAVGALALGATGLLMTVAVQAMAFAGGMWVSQQGQQHLEETNRKLHYEATHDTLTGLKNRGAIMGVLEEGLQQWGGRRRHLAVVMADVDHFKRINDTWGHQAGDAVLQEVAARISAALRSEDAVGRYGGEEIMVVLPGLDTSEATRAAERLRLELSSRPFAAGTASLEVTASFGVASSAELEEATGADLIRLADEALYRAKSRGRNRVEAAS